MIGGRVRWTTMMTKGVIELAVTIICVTKTTRRMSSAKLKRTYTTFWWNNFYFLSFFYLFAMTKKDFSCISQLICLSTQDS